MTDHRPICEAMEDCILDAVDRPLDPPRARELAMHLAACPDCRAFQAAQHRLEAALQTALPPRALSESVRAGLRTLPAREPAVPLLAGDSAEREFWRHLATHSLPQGLTLLAGSLTAIIVFWHTAGSLPSDFLETPALATHLLNPWLGVSISLGVIAAGVGFAFRGRLQAYLS